MSTREAALAAYRHILRSATIAFKGDARMLMGARMQARQGFEQARNLSEGSDEFKHGVAQAEDVARILRENVVQGEANESGDQYRLNIHEQTERGDNETIKVAGQKLKQKPAR